MKRELIEIKNAMSRNFDVREEKEDFFSAECHVKSGKFFASEMINLWVLEDHCYAYVHYVENLNEEKLTSICKNSLDLGLPKVDPGPEHRCSSILSIVVCEKIADGLEKSIKKYAFVKNYKLSLRGWAEHGLAVAVLSDGKIITNRDGKETGKTLEKMDFFNGVKN